MRLEKEIQRRVEARLAELGASDIRFDQSGKHPRIRFRANGVPGMCVVSRSPSDQKAILAAVTAAGKAFRSAASRSPVPAGP